MSEESDLAEYRLDGSLLWAAVSVSAAPEALSFDFVLRNPRNGRLMHVDPPTPEAGDARPGRPYLLLRPGFLSIPQVLVALDGKELLCSAAIQPGEGGTPRLTLHLLQGPAADALGEPLKSVTTDFAQDEQGAWVARLMMRLRGTSAGGGV